jgi:uncharacterized protein (DUF433 family)
MIVSASRHGQLAMDILKEFLLPVSGLTFAEKVADTWEPRPFIILDPEVQFGDPCIKGTRIPVRSVWGMVRGGDSEELVQRAYGIHELELKAALDWGDSVAAAA